MAEEELKFDSAPTYFTAEFSVNKPSWILPNELIERLNLSPDDKFQGTQLMVMGEDGKTYDWCYVLKKHMDWVESK